MSQFIGNNGEYGGLGLNGGFNQPGFNLDLRLDFSGFGKHVIFERGPFLKICLFCWDKNTCLSKNIIKKKFVINGPCRQSCNEEDPPDGCPLGMCDPFFF